MPLLNYTTKIDADKTAQEISKCLSRHGAKSVLTDYNEQDGVVEAISFRISLNGKDISFRLPCDWRPVYAVLIEGKDDTHRYNKEKREKWEMEWRLQAVRTSWRIIKDWVEAQMALVETQMASTLQVFLPYAQSADGSTLYEKIAENPQLLLGNN